MGSKQVNFGFGQRVQKQRGDKVDPSAGSEANRQHDGRVGQREQRECFLCHKKGHIARGCRNRGQKVAALQSGGKYRQNTVEARVEAQTISGIWGEATSGTDFAGSNRSIHGDEVKLPDVQGWVDKRKVDVLRDTGCSCGVVRAELVPDHCLTGESRKCTLIDGSVKEFPVANIQVTTPFYSGTLAALVMPNPLYPLIAGNVPSARDPNDPELVTAGEAAAVETRGQAQKRRKGNTPLTTFMRKWGINASPKDLKEEQSKDEYLQKLFAWAEKAEEKEIHGGTVAFHLEKGLLYWVYISKQPVSAGGTYGNSYSGRLSSLWRMNPLCLVIWGRARLQTG